LVIKYFLCPFLGKTLKSRKKYSKKKSIAGGAGRVLETLDLKYFDSLNQKFKSQED